MKKAGIIFLLIIMIFTLASCTKDDGKNTTVDSLKTVTNVEDSFSTDTKVTNETNNKATESTESSAENVDSSEKTESAESIEDNIKSSSEEAVTTENTVDNDVNSSDNNQDAGEGEAGDVSTVVVTEDFEIEIGENEEVGGF